MPDLIGAPLALLGALLLGLVVGSGVAGLRRGCPWGKPSWRAPLPAHGTTPDLGGSAAPAGLHRATGVLSPLWVAPAALGAGGRSEHGRYCPPQLWLRRLTPRFLVYVAEGAVLLLILVMDWRHHDVYTLVVGVGAVSALLGGALLPEIGLGGALAGGVGGALVMLVLWGLGWVLGRRS